MVILVVIREKWIDMIRATPSHSSWSVLIGRGVTVGLNFGSIGTDLQNQEIFLLYLFSKALNLAPIRPKFDVRFFIDSTSWIHVKYAIYTGSGIQIPATACQIFL